MSGAGAETTILNVSPSTKSRPWSRLVDGPTFERLPNETDEPADDIARVAVHRISAARGRTSGDGRRSPARRASSRPTAIDLTEHLHGGDL